MRQHLEQKLKQGYYSEKGGTTWNEIVLNRIKVKEVWIRHSDTFNVTALSELVSKKGAKVQVVEGDDDWDQELEWIFQDMEV